MPDRYVQVGWWDKDRGFMHALHYSTAESGLTPLYERQWPLETDPARDQQDDPSMAEGRGVRRCPSRCWFAVGVGTGVQTTTCQRCGHPNPRWSEAKQAVYDEYMAPPDPREWVRCYDIYDDGVDDEGWAWCNTHHQRVSVKTRGDSGPWHLYLTYPATSRDAVLDELADLAFGPLRPKSS